VDEVRRRRRKRRTAASKAQKGPVGRRWRRCRQEAAKGRVSGQTEIIPNSQVFNVIVIF
ncbi:MAG: hypothetical protein GWO11_01730, partial [Desulfuromonadales bacterium]|nr:hypothetical protein [Desulfuromonadales bacterium]NIS40718.1 hypothetical protein [Desulfuromonadales bacterium]